VVLYTKPQELIRCTSGNLIPIHSLLETRPSLGHGALVELKRSRYGVPVDLCWFSIRDCASRGVGGTYDRVTVIDQDQV
jgi:hypothetical protein